MEIIYLLIPLSLLLLAVACWAFFWAVKHDQFEDMDVHAHCVLETDQELDSSFQETKE